VIKRSQVKHRYALSCVFSSVAGLLGVLNPLLIILLVDKAKNNFEILNLLPTLTILIATKILQFVLRVKTAKYLKGNQRAPIIWIQHRIGKWLWWMEPMLHNWGWVGMFVTKISGSSGIAAQIASAVTYTLNDTLITVASGVIYYFTDSYVLSFLTILILPAIFVIPWITEKTLKLKSFTKDYDEYRVLKRNIWSKK
jgi:ABC-type bacteriocin/lantibiotic exporter with double-glycine peptidase domain